MPSPQQPGPAAPRFIGLLLAAFGLLGAVYAIVTPLFEVSDELWHYPMVKTLADGNGLPVQDPASVGPWRQEGSQPPLYYAVMALATAWIDTSDMDQVRWVNPHADNGIITPDRNNNIVVHTSREAWPWRGTVLAVRLIRLLSVLLGAGTVYFTWRLARELAPDRPGLALAAAGFAAFTPMFLFISASVNNDNLAIFCSAAALWLLARWLRRPPEKLGGAHLALGALLGCGALSKQSALGLLPIAGLVLVYPYVFGRDGKRARAAGPGLKWLPAFVTEAGVVFGLALLIAGWWYWRNFQLYGDWLGWNSFIAIVGRRPHPATLAQLWGERAGFVQAYWGLFGGVSVPMPGWTYLALNAAAGLGLLGLAWGLVRWLARRRKPPVDSLSLALWTLPAAWIALIVFGLIRWTSLTWASQGRLIFPAISAISLLVVWGLAHWHRSLPWLVVGLMAGLAAAVPFTVIAPHYAPPPELGAGQIASIPTRVEADFGGEMRLLGYDLRTPSARPGEPVELTLYWQSQIAMDRNWSIFVHVVDEAGVIVAQRDRYPAMGALATTLLRPGQTFADDYAIPIPRTAYSPVEARLVVGLYDLADGARAHLPDGDDSLALRSLAIEAWPGEVPNPLALNFGNQIQLSGYDMGPRALRPGGTLELTLFWEALRPLSTNYAVFTHVRGEGETLWGGEDAWPQKGAAPTAGWTAGQLVPDSYRLTLKPDTPPGLYDVEIGLYHAETLERLRLFTRDGWPSDADYVFLSKIRVLP